MGRYTRDLPFWPAGKLLPANAGLLLYDPESDDDYQLAPAGLPGGGAGGPLQDYTATETLGGIAAGDVFQTADPALVKLLVRYQAPAFTALAVGGLGSRTVEVGTAFAASTAAAPTPVTWATANAGNVAPGSLAFQDVTAGTTLASGEANDGQLGAALAGFTAVLGESRRYRLTGTNSEQAPFRADLVIAGAYLAFWGVCAALPTGSAAVRALPGYQLSGQGFTATLLTDTTSTSFCIAVPPGFAVASIIDTDHLNQDILGSFTVEPVLPVNDAAGAAVPGYTRYFLTVGVAYTRPTHLVFNVVPH